MHDTNDTNDTNTTNTRDSDEGFSGPKGIAFIPARPEWLVIADANNHRVKIHDSRTGKMVCTRLAHW
jgi:hypothetical protein